MDTDTYLNLWHNEVANTRKVSMLTANTTDRYYTGDDGGGNSFIRWLVYFYFNQWTQPQRKLRGMISNRQPTNQNFEAKMLLVDQKQVNRSANSTWL